MTDGDRDDGDAGDAGDRVTTEDDAVQVTPGGESAESGGSDGDLRPRQAPPPDDEFGPHGWVLVGLLVVAFLVIPGVLVLLPRYGGVVRSLGLTFRDAYLVLPLVPAFLLGAAAVLVALHSRRG